MRIEPSKGENKMAPERTEPQGDKEMEERLDQAAEVTVGLLTGNSIFLVLVDSHFFLCLLHLYHDCRSTKTLTNLRPRRSRWVAEQGGKAIRVQAYWMYVVLSIRGCLN